MDVSNRSSTVIVALLAATIVPRIERVTGVKLTLDDVAALFSLAVVVWHGLATAFERYFPPPSPTQPAHPAGEPK